MDARRKSSNRGWIFSVVKTSEYEPWLGSTHEPPGINGVGGAGAEDVSVGALCKAA
jgi:hypothetical protein